MTSNAQKRVAIDKAVFGHRVVASLTGNTMSTPDAHKPDLVEVAVLRSDHDLGHVWVPVEATSTLTYEVRIEFHQEDFASPTDAVLGMIAHLRHAEPGDLSFNVRCVEDNVTYGVDAGMGEDGWDAYVTSAIQPNPERTGSTLPRDDLMPYTNTQE